MSFKSPKFPSSKAFEDIQSVLANDEATRKDALKSAAGVFGFTLKNGAGETESWHIDLKDKGEVGKGEAPAGKKADIILTLNDADFQKLIDGKAKAQQLFMGGKLKIKGNVMKATKLEPVLNKARSKANL